MKNRLIALIFTMVLLQVSADDNTADKFVSSYGILLKKFIKVSTSTNGTIITSVDYRGLRESNDCAITAIYLAKVSNIEKMESKEQLAFWINAYNFLVINKVVKNPKIKKLTDLNTLFTSVWKQPSGKVAGKIYSLDEIEHGIIRKKFKEPRIHFAVVCGAKSCPNIRNEAYTGKKLDEQLNEQVKQFLSNTKKGMKIDKTAEKIYLSKIFKWFSTDFNNKPLEWLLKKKMIDKIEKDKYSIKYLNYDWSLNKERVN